MPKHRVLGRGDPYRNYLENRQYGFRRHGVMDKLYRQMADDMLNITARLVLSQRSCFIVFDAAKETPSSVHTLNILSILSIVYRVI